MARRGRFGRRPRSTGNLTALVASLYREQRQAEDRVMFDAYNNGGMVDGKPVDDARMRAYVAARRDGFSKDDPLYDEWSNRLIQLDFRIGEEKITLAFQQGKVGAGAVAAYYRQQLKSIPQESAFYREVAGRAAQWAKSAAGAARGSARASLAKAVQGKFDALAKTQADFAAVDDIVRQAAIRAGLIDANDPVTAADASQLQALFDAGIVGPKGTAITFNDWRGAVVGLYKTFDTHIALNKQLNRGVKELTENKAKFFEQVVLGSNAIDDRGKYEAARDIWLQSISTAQNDPAAILEANKKYAAALGKIMASATTATGEEANSSEFIGALQNEINAVVDGKYTGPGVVDVWKRSDAGDFDGVITEGDDTSSTAESIKITLDNAKMLDAGTAYYGQSEFGGPMEVIPFPPGAALDPFGRNGLGPDSTPAIVEINGQPKQAVLKGQAIKSSALVDPNGQPVTQVDDGRGNFIPVENLSPNQLSTLLANGFTKEDGGVIGYVYQQGQKQTFGVIDPATGQIKFTESNPFAGTLAPSEGGFTVFGGASYDESGKIVNAPPKVIFDLTNADSLLIDSTVLPGDLRNAAKFELDPDKQAALLALADKRQNSYGDPERDAQMRAQGKEKGTAQGSVLDEFFAGSAVDMVRRALGVIPEIKLGQNASPPAIAMKTAAQIPGIGAAVPQAPSIVTPPPISPSQTAANTASQVPGIGGAVPIPAPKPSPEQTAVNTASQLPGAGGVLDQYTKPKPTGTGGGGTNIAL